MFLIVYCSIDLNYSPVLLLVYPGIVTYRYASLRINAE